MRRAPLPHRAAQEAPLRLGRGQRGFCQGERAFGLIDTAHAARLRIEHLLRALHGNLCGVDLHLRLQHAAICGGLQVRQTQHLVQGAAKHRRGRLSFSSQGKHDLP